MKKTNINKNDSLKKRGTWHHLLSQLLFFCINGLVHPNDGQCPPLFVLFASWPCMYVYFLWVHGLTNGSIRHTMLDKKGPEEKSARSRFALTFCFLLGRSDFGYNAGGVGDMVRFSGSQAPCWYLSTFSFVRSNIWYVYVCMIARGRKRERKTNDTNEKREKERWKEKRENEKRERCGPGR